MVEEGGDNTSPDASSKIEKGTEAVGTSASGGAGDIPAPKKISEVRSSKTDMVNMKGMLGRQDQTGSMAPADIDVAKDAASASARSASLANSPNSPSAQPPNSTHPPNSTNPSNSARSTYPPGGLPRPAGENTGKYAPEFFGAYAHEVRRDAPKASFPQPDPAKPVQPPQAPPQFLDDETDMSMGEDGLPLFGSAAKHSGAPISMLTNRTQIPKKPPNKLPVLQFIKDNAVLSSLVLALVLVSATFLYIQKEHKLDSNVSLDLSFLSAGPSLQEVQQEVQQAIAGQKYESALTLTNAFIQKNPKSAEGFHERGRLFLAMHRYQDAGDNLTTAVSFNPRQKDIHIDRAAALYYLDDYDKACLEYDNILQIDSQDASAYFGKGLAEAKLKQQEAALKDFKKAVELNPDYPAPFNAMGDLHSEQGQLKLAYDDFSHAIQLAEQITAKGDAGDGSDQSQVKTNTAKYYFNRANCSRHDHKIDKAVQDYTKAIDLNGELPEYFNNRGLCFLDEKNYTKAADDFSSALRLDPNYTGAQHNLVLAQGHVKH